MNTASSADGNRFMNSAMKHMFAALTLALASATAAQEVPHDHHDNASTAEQTPAVEDAAQMEQSGASDTGMDHSQHMATTDEMESTDHSGHVNHAAAPDADTPDTEALRDPHAYAEGADFGPLGQLRLSDQHSFGALLVDRLETVHTSDNNSFAYEAQAWFGRTYDRLTVKAEGEADSGELHDSRTELLWSHAIASFWDTQLGIRHDSGEQPDRNWLAFGVQGLAPYWFHVDATAYLGEGGDTALRLAAEYEMLFTQRLILQPKVEANLYGQNDDVRGTGSGLSDLSVGLRLRYEITRQFAPYVGIEWAGLVGGTADYARQANASTDETRWVAGVRFWF
jgi:copper resistance protein B